MPPMMLIHHILKSAQRRLAVLSREASMVDAAEILANPDTPLVVVCDDSGVAVGVVSSTDIVKAFSRARGEAPHVNAEDIMTRLIFSCDADQTLQSVWTSMSAHSLRCAPVLDADRKPRGVVHAREIVLALLDEVTHEELLLRDYVLGIGYQ
jgi:CBS domain-containing protein